MYVGCYSPISQHKETLISFSRPYFLGRMALGGGGSQRFSQDVFFSHNHAVVKQCETFFFVVENELACFFEVLFFVGKQVGFTICYDSTLRSK